MAIYLDRILAAHRAAAGDDRRDIDALVAEATAQPAARGFRAALRTSDSIAVISEIKRRSPSKGDLAPDLDPADLAARYTAGGAAALSVLTDVEFFGGSVADLCAARAAVAVPVLRKDFTVGPADVLDARIMGADAVLLIAAALDPGELAELYRLAVRVGLDALVEVHDESEAEVALAAGATMIGVNQRDLTSFEVDTDRARRVGAALPDHVVRVAESGIRDADDVRVLADAGFDAILVGETLVRSADPAAAVAGLSVTRSRA
ncbi:MAG TPA: indole-3-glycerol phosphate synthase TrpC [Acidimicrobiales bacterium]|jgi:indole-3-glycerol phosphate synthase|nr:indole-3-glycerol phosphate synthase TrpC [Acidimicrobiales bacterium]